MLQLIIVTMRRRAENVDESVRILDKFEQESVVESLMTEHARYMKYSRWALTIIVVVACVRLVGAILYGFFGDEYGVVVVHVLTISSLSCSLVVAWRTADRTSGTIAVSAIAGAVPTVYWAHELYAGLTANDSVLEQQLATLATGPRNGPGQAIRLSNHGKLDAEHALVIFALAALCGVILFASKFVRDSDIVFNRGLRDLRGNMYDPSRA